MIVAVCFKPRIVWYVTSTSFFFFVALQNFNAKHTHTHTQGGVASGDVGQSLEPGLLSDLLNSSADHLGQGIVCWIGFACECFCVCVELS